MYAVCVVCHRNPVTEEHDGTCDACAKDPAVMRRVVALQRRELFALKRAEVEYVALHDGRSKHVTHHVRSVEDLDDLFGAGHDESSVVGIARRLLATREA